MFDVLVVMVVASGTTTTVPTVTNSAGLTFTLVAEALMTASVDRLYVFVSNEFVSSATSQTVTFDCTGDNATGAVVFVASVSSMARTALNGAVRQFNTKHNTAAGTPSVVYDIAPLTGNVVLGLVGNATNPAGLTPPSGWTENAAGDTGYTVPTTGAEYAYQNSGFTSTTVTWGSASASAYGAIIFELDTSAAPTYLITPVGTPTVNSSATARTSEALTPPSGTQADDILFAYIGGSIITGVGVTPPDGTWTQIDAETSVTSAYGHLFYKRLTAAASGTYTFTHNSSVTVGVMWARRGIDTTTLLDKTVVAGDFIADSAAPFDVPAITTATDQAFALVVCSTEWTSSGYLTNGPSGYTKIAHFSPGASQVQVCIAEREIVTAGTTPAAHFEIATTPKNTVIGQFALKPAGGGTETGAAALTGQGRMTVAGSGVSSGASALQGRGRLTVQASATSAGTAAVQGRGRIAVVGTAAASGVAPLTGHGRMTAVGTTTGGAETGAVALSAHGTLTASASASAQGAAALTAHGTLTAQATATSAGAAATLGRGRLTAIATASTTGGGVLSGRGRLTAVGSATAGGVAPLTGRGALTVSAAAASTGTVAVQGRGRMVVAASTTAGNSGAAVLQAHGALTAQGSGVSSGVAALPAHGTLTAAAGAATAGAGVLSGRGRLAAVGQVAGSDVQAAAVLSGRARLAAVGSTVSSGAAALEGRGRMAAEGHAIGAEPAPERRTLHFSGTDRVLVAAASDHVLVVGARDRIITEGPVDRTVSD